MQFAITQEIKPQFNHQGVQKRSPYSLRYARIAHRKQNTHSLKKSAFKSKQEKHNKVEKVAKKAPNRPIYTQKNAANTVAKAAILASSINAKCVNIKQQCHIQKQTCDSASTTFEFDSNFQNYQECEYESTYLNSDFKTTPALPQPKPKCVGYYLRSSVAPNVRKPAEATDAPVLLPFFGQKPAKLTEQVTCDAPRKTAVTEQALKRPNKIAQSVEISGLASPQFGLVAAQSERDVTATAAVPTTFDEPIRTMALPPLSQKVFREPEPLQQVELDVTSLKSAPPAVKTFKSSRAQPAKVSTFLMIKEKEFPHLFENPIVRHQRMAKFFDEQDFNSDCETVERNKVDLLKQLEQTVSRYNKNEPSKFVENIKSPPSNMDAVSCTLERQATPMWASTPVFSGAAFSNMAQQTSAASDCKNFNVNFNGRDQQQQVVEEDNQNKNRCFKKLELAIDTPIKDRNNFTINPFQPHDGGMETPKSDISMSSPGIGGTNTSPSNRVDSASIAFGVMYQPRTRIQRIDQFNCDTRHLREGFVDLSPPRNDANNCPKSMDDKAVEDDELVINLQNSENYVQNGLGLIPKSQSSTTSVNQKLTQDAATSWFD